MKKKKLSIKINMVDVVKKDRAPHLPTKPHKSKKHKSRAKIKQEIRKKIQEELE
jgi:hypothetical protein